MNSAVDVLSMFRRDTECVLLDPYDKELYSGTVRQAINYLMKYPQYDILPENGGWWLNIEQNTLVVYLDEVFE